MATTGRFTSGKKVDATYGAIHVGHNTNEGYTYNLTASLAKKFGFGLDASLAYNFGDGKALNEGTSSQNSSQWRGQTNTDGRNFPNADVLTSPSATWVILAYDRLE